MSDRMPQKNLMIGKEKQKILLKKSMKEKLQEKEKNNCSKLSLEVILQKFGEFFIFYFYLTFKINIMTS